MHHAPHSRLLTRSEQSGNAIDVDTARAIFWSILKHASAVYNRINPIEVRDPKARLCHSGDVARSPLCVRPPPSIFFDIAGKTEHIMACGDESRGDCRTDQSRRSSDHYTQKSSPSRRN
jgi:hypothetical protein